MHVQPVADQLRNDAVPLAGRPDHAGLAVVDRRHGVVQVGQMRRPGVKDGGGFVIVCVRVRDRHGAQRPGLFGKGSRARQLRRDVHDAQQAAAALMQGAEGPDVRQTQVGAVLSALFLFGEEGALHVDAHRPCAVGGAVFMEPYRRIERGGQGLVRQGHRGGSEARHAAAGEILAHAREARQIPVGEVGAHRAVGVDIHQTRQHLRAAQVAPAGALAGENLGKTAVFHGKAAADIALTGQKQFGVYKQHLTPRAGSRPRCSGPRGGLSHPAASR